MEQRVTMRFCKVKMPPNKRLHPTPLCCARGAGEALPLGGRSSKNHQVYSMNQETPGEDPRRLFFVCGSAQGATHLPSASHLNMTNASPLLAGRRTTDRVAPCGAQAANGRCGRPAGIHPSDGWRSPGGCRRVTHRRWGSRWRRPWPAPPRTPGAC